MDREVLAARLRAAGCVFAEDEATLLLDSAPTSADLESMVLKRVDGLPLEQVLGWVEFCGLRIVVEAGVFVPRRRTELLVNEAISIAERSVAPVVVDLCCGSGAVGVAVATRIDGVDLYAVDIDPAAVRCARRNVERVGGRVYEGDLGEPLPAVLGGRVDVVVANAPYVPSGEFRLLPQEARVYEPRSALDGGADGLDIQRQVAAGARRLLASGGSLLIETGAHQVAGTVDAMARTGLVAQIARSEELGATVVIGRLEENSDLQ